MSAPPPSSLGFPCKCLNVFLTLSVSQIKLVLEFSNALAQKFNFHVFHCQFAAQGKYKKKKKKEGEGSQKVIKFK
jgi:hypothetical protein